MYRRIGFARLILMCLILIFIQGSFFDIIYGASKPFLDEKKALLPQLEWNREIVSRNGGSVAFRVSSQEPIGVTLITERGYKAVMANDRKAFRNEDLILTVDSKNGLYEGNETVPPGSSWFIIQNQSDKDVEIHLQCF